MNARFVPVVLPRPRVIAFSTLGLVALNCSVFPDKATLPAPTARAGAGGETAFAEAGAAGQAYVRPLGGASDGGAFSLPAGGAGAGAGGEDAAAAGAGGEAPICAEPRQAVIDVTIDTWIESAKPGAGHDSDELLMVVAGPGEQRALLQVTVPAAPSGATLIQAFLALHLQANADVSQAARVLRLHPLRRAFNPGKANWTNYSNGQARWDTPGGDFDDPIAELTVPSATTDASLTFDVTESVRDRFGASPVELRVLVLEAGPAPAAPAELAFTSSEGEASQRPALVLTYCQP